MARTKANPSASTLIDEKIEVETETKEVEVTDKVEDTPKETEASDEVTICCESLAGKTCVISETTTLNFDEKGKAKVKGIEAKRLLTIPGYKLAK